jgi:hypothetical protein
MQSDLSRDQGNEGKPTQELLDGLADFIADLLALKSNQPFLKALFEQPPGYWLELKTLCSSLHAVVSDLATLESQGQGQLRVTWLEYPETSPDYCLVLFYFDSLGWNSLALYHRSQIAQ